MSAFRIVCAWCDAVEHEGDPDALTSHTICPTCFKKLTGVEPTPTLL
jgi:hypothetical protein